MQKYKQVFLKENGCRECDIILCELRAEGCENVAVDIHHIEPRGMGGSKHKDYNENLIALCRSCHNLAEAKKVSKDELKELALKRIERRQNAFSY